MALMDGRRSAGTVRPAAAVKHNRSQLARSFTSAHTVVRSGHDPPSRR
jgi:hypothetical protein